MGPPKNGVMKKAGQTHGTQVFGFKREGMAGLVLASLRRHPSLQRDIAVGNNVSLFSDHLQLSAPQLLTLLMEPKL